MPYPKRLIEVDLPIKRISAHARREKSIRHGHISTLHIWWARRPLAACRAVLCASLWPDPADPLCPKEFIEFAQKEMIKWSNNDHLPLLSKESIERFIKVNHSKKLVENKEFLRALLLDFIADFANWDNSINVEFLSTSRSLTQIAHVALGGEPGTNPLVVDPFAGGGSIPLEALRVGADAFASDLNPIPVLLNKIQLELIPKHGKTLVNEVRKWGQWLKDEVEKEVGKYYAGLKEPLAEYYLPQIKPIIKKGAQLWKFKSIVKENPIGFIWARKIKCEGPACGIEYPLMRTKYLSKKGDNSIGYKFIVDKKTKRITYELIHGIKAKEALGTVQRGVAVCPSCGFTTNSKNVREQLKLRSGGADDAFLIAIVSMLKSEREFNNRHEIIEESNRFYRIAFDEDKKLFDQSKHDYEKNYQDSDLIPKENLPIPAGEREGTLGIGVQGYGIKTWDKIFNSRQLLILGTYLKHLKAEKSKIDKDAFVILALAISRLTDIYNSLCMWENTKTQIRHTFTRQAIPFLWDYAEANAFSDAAGNFMTTLGSMLRVIDRLSEIKNVGTVVKASATKSILPEDSFDILFTDPPYYDAVPYSDISDFFYVWLKRGLEEIYPELFEQRLTNKEEECIVDYDKGKDKQYFESTMQKALRNQRFGLKPSGITTIVFAHKTTDGWEAQLNAIIEAGYVITASWPIDTELANRVRAQGSAALASSVHLVCRPRENEDGSLIQNQIGDWRDVQQELPKRIHEWMPRLAAEGVAGADAIFACLGPALEIFSRYSSVEKPNGDVVTLREYLEKVWAAVSQEALNMVFTGGEAQGLEEDARITAMWLWTLTAGASDNITSDDEDESDDEETTSSGKLTGGFTLEYDTARKIAQGLGANLEDLKTLVEVKGDKARLLPVMERTSKLFGSAGMQQQPIKKKKKVQLSLSFENVEPEEESKFEMPELKVEQTGNTVLDRLHQAMLLFSTGRTEALKRFLVEDGAGKDDRFWKLAQSLTSLYPKDTNERRWVEAVQTYKKSLGF
jgi:putative DNA methylase